MSPCVAAEGALVCWHKTPVVRCLCAVPYHPLVISRLVSTPRRRVAAVLTVTAAVVALGSWTLWPVHDSSCVVYSGAYVPMNAPKTEVDAAAQRDYDKALADGACGPKRARFHNWTQ
ncbi:hypothetical protein GCM10023323_23710 [Streptomyces thinghirensis]|uniref:Uncharacterized protein n=1 Tax=Streptomyces thinghirensis TaxID=551547 RepID=A0ABP9SZT3_9ACTN